MTGREREKREKERKREREREKVRARESVSEQEREKRGREREKERTRERLNMLVYTPYAFSECNKSHTQTTRSKEEKVKRLLPQLFQNNLLCAGSVIGTQGSCNGDSGGPLMTYNIGTKQWTQIATVEGGIGKV